MSTKRTGKTNAIYPGSSQEHTVPFIYASSLFVPKLAANIQKHTHAALCWARGVHKVF